MAEALRAIDPVVRESDPAILQKAYRKVTLKLVPFLFICYLFNYLDRVNVGFAKLQMLDALKWSKTVYGLGAGIFFIGYVLSGVPSNIILHRIGARRAIGAMLFAWGIGSACLMFVTTPASFYALRFMTGVFEAVFFPASSSISRNGTRRRSAAGSWVCSCPPFRSPASSAARFRAG